MYRFELFDVDRVNRRVICIVRVKYSENELERVFAGICEQILLLQLLILLLI